MRRDERGHVGQIEGLADEPFERRHTGVLDSAGHDRLEPREIVAHVRETAIPFYARLGYERRGSRFVEVTLPHFLMRKIISTDLAGGRVTGTGGVA